MEHHSVLSKLEMVRAAREDAARIRERSRLTRERSAALRKDSHELLKRHAQIYAKYIFYLRCKIDGHLAVAFWQGGVVASEQLRARADLVVSLGDTFTLPGREEVIAASLHDPLAAVLTLVRASDRLDRLVLALGGGVDAGFLWPSVERDLRTNTSWVPSGPGGVPMVELDGEHEGGSG